MRLWLSVAVVVALCGCTIHKDGDAVSIDHRERYVAQYGQPTAIQRDAAGNEVYEFCNHGERITFAVVHHEWTRKEHYGAYNAEYHFSVDNVEVLRREGMPRCL